MKWRYVILVLFAAGAIVGAMTPQWAPNSHGLARMLGSGIATIGMGSILPLLVWGLFFKFARTKSRQMAIWSLLLGSGFVYLAYTGANL